LYRARQHFANLDGLRFVCIAMVVWHHGIPLDQETAQIFLRGFLGVDFFFVLSGFLITTLLLRERSEYGDFSLRDFYLRRVLRIFPVYFFVVGSVSTYYVFIDGQTELARLVPFYFLFLSNFLVEHIPNLYITWSLAVEEQYYLVWPLVLLLVRTQYLIPLSLFLIAINVAGIMGAFGPEPTGNGIFRIWLPNSTYAPIIMGSLLGLILHSAQGFRVVERLLGGRWVAISGFCLLAITIQLAPSDLRGLPNLVIHTIMVGTLAALVVREDNAALAVLRNPLFARVGAVSYGIYLYHLLVLDVVNRIAGRLEIMDQWTILALYSVLSYLVAEISMRTLEAYFRRFRPVPRSAG
jgi:peptidoglycan/LPS O-acetylase OafA/YrhL